MPDTHNKTTPDNTKLEHHHCTEPTRSTIALGLPYRDPNPLVWLAYLSIGTLLSFLAYLQSEEQLQAVLNTVPSPEANGLINRLATLNSLGIFCIALIILASLHYRHKRQQQLSAQRIEQLTEQNTKLYREAALSSQQNRFQHRERMLAIDLVCKGLSHELGSPIKSAIANLQVFSNQQQKAHYKLKQQAATATAPQWVKELLLLHTDGEAQLQESLQQLQKSLHPLQNLRHFSPKNSNTTTTVDLHHCLDSAIQKAAPFTPAQTEICRNYAIELPCLNGYPDEIEQTFIYLLIHMLSGTQQNSTLLVQTRYADEAITIEIFTIEKPVKTESSQCIFDPFLASHQSQDGSGLGLSICNEIINYHQGQLEISSELGRGTTYSIYFSRAK